MNKKISLAAVVLLLGTYVFSPVAAWEEARITEGEEQVVKANKSTLDKARAAINNKNFVSAIDYLSVYIDSKPKKYEPYEMRGDAYYALRLYSDAERDYQTAIDIKSAGDKLITNTKYLSAVVLGADKNEQLQNVELGNLYGKLMYAQKAQNAPAYATAYENALKYNSHIYLPQPKKENIAMINCPQKYGKPLNPDGIDADIYGAIDDIKNENYSQAIFRIQNVISQYPQYYLGYYLYGVALAGLEKDDEAISAFQKALDINPYDFESLASLGQIYYSKAETTFSQDDAKKSIEYFNKALEANPNCYIYYFYIGLNELQRGNTDLAVESFNNALKINPQDYNSMYYKSIAQYNKGNYDDVVKTTTKLLYRHVSNYNSVLYLRALANSKSGNYDSALEDLASIKNNIEDIFNADIKVVTDRDKALESYVYYLKSEIESNNNSDIISADRQKALLNPVISQLSKAETALKPYKKALNSDKISIADYRKYESFYNTGLAKMLSAGVVIPQNDVENQYDYIRTTFDDLGLSFKYLNPDYSLSIIPDYPYKKYSSKLSTEDFAQAVSEVPQDVREATTALNPYQMQEKTPQIEMIANKEKPSLAQMLASNQLPFVSVSVPEKNTAAQEIKKSEDANVKNPEFKPEIPDAEKINTSSNIASGEPFIYIDKSKAPINQENKQNLTEIIKQEKAAETKIIPEQTDSKGSVKITAAETKQTPDITIKYDEPKPAITEKHADVNPKDFGIEAPKPSKMPIINPDDEVIELSQRDLVREVIPELQEKTVETVSETTADKVASSSFAGTKQEVKNVKEKLSQTPKVVLPETQQPQKEETAVEVPVVIVPEIKAPANVDAEVKTAPVIRTSDTVELLPQTQEIKAVEQVSEPEPHYPSKDELRAMERAEKAQAKMLERARKIELKEQKKAQAQKLKQERAEAKALKKQAELEEKIKAQEDKAQEIIRQQALKEQEKLVQEQQKAELKAQKEQQRVYQYTQEQEFETKLETIKQENERLKSELETQKKLEKIKAREENEQLKKERAEAYAELKSRRRAEKEAERKAEKEAEAWAKNVEKEQAKAEKAANAVTERKKFSIKEFFAKFRKESNSEEKNVKRTVIKSRE